MANENENTDSASGYELMLFISGMSIRSTHAIENIRKICSDNIPDADLKIVDISLDKQKAIDYQIIGIPSLIKMRPLPFRMILGDLSDTEKVLKILDIRS